MNSVEDLAIKILNNMIPDRKYSRKYIVEEQRQSLMIPMEAKNNFNIKIGFAITLLVRKGLIKRTSRGIYELTNLGIKQSRQDINELNKRLEYDINVIKNRRIAYKLFKIANKKFLQEDRENIDRDVSERSLCARLAQFLTEAMASEKVKEYYAETEYDRNEHYVKAIIDNEMRVIKIKCDLIVHSRGENKKQDNLIAIEMKKSTNYRSRKEDRERLQYMTKSTYTNEEQFEEIPKYICRYALGIFYYINIKKREIELEYYENGFMCKKEKIKY